MCKCSSADILVEEMPVSDGCLLEKGNCVCSLRHIVEDVTMVQDCVASSPRNSCKSATMFARLASVASRLALSPCFWHNTAKSMAAIAITRSEGRFAPRNFVL